MHDYIRRSQKQRGAFTMIEGLLIAAIGVILVMVAAFCMRTAGTEAKSTSVPVQSAAAPKAATVNVPDQEKWAGSEKDDERGEDWSASLISSKVGPDEWSRPGSGVSSNKPVGKLPVLPAVNDKMQIVTDFKEALLNKDPLAAFGVGRISRMTVEELQACLNQAAGMEAGPAATKLLSELIAHWASMDPAAAAAYAGSVSSLRLRGDLLASAMNIWAARDMAAAVSFAQGIENRRTQSGILQNLLNTWSTQDPEAALKWLQSNPNTDPRMMYSCVTNLFVHLTRQDPAMALSKAWDISNERGGKNVAIRSIADELVKNEGMDALLGFYAGMQAGENKALLRDEIVRQMAYYQPSKAMEWINATISDSGERNAAMDRLLYTWSSDQPEQAARWIMTQLPDGETKEEQLSHAVRAWIHDNSAAAVQWLSEYPSSPVTDSSAMVVARELARTAPTVAIQWAESITDANTRSSAIEQVAARWMTKDSAQATAYVQASTLPDDVKKRILSGQSLRSYGRGRFSRGMR
jgi:hypothetical protein